MTIRRILKLVVLAPVAAVAVVLAVANRTPVTLSLDPFSREAPAMVVTLPLFAVVFLAAIVGVVIGGTLVWLRQGQYRKRCRKAEAALAEARGETERLRDELVSSAPPAPSGGPVGFLNRPAA